MSTLLYLDDVSRRYKAVTALHPITLDIPAGARHAVIGPNGAGKSTLLSLIAGSTRPSGGHIRFDQRPIDHRSAAARARAGIGRTFQYPALAEHLTAADNCALAVRLPQRLDRARAATRRARAAAALEQVGLGGDAATRVGRLPYGRRRLLEIATVLAARPRLLLLDEPSAGLDPAEITALTDVLRRLDPAVTVILVDHHMPLIWDIADTVTVLNTGRLIATGPAAQVRDDERVRDAYLSTVPPVTSRSNRTPGAPRLVVTDLTAGYHGAPALDRVDLTVHAGQVHAVLGRNGAGKSTLINTIAGLLTPRTGSRIEIDTTEHTPGPADRPVALVPQGRRLFISLTVAEHLRLAAATGRRTHQPTTGRRVDDVLGLLPELKPLLRRRPGQMSGGQQQLLAVARALLQQPRLLLLDEPSEGLAPQIVDRLAALITRVADSGMAVLLAEQNQRLAHTVADRISVLEHGRIVFTTTDLAQPDTKKQIAGLLGVATTADAA